MKRTAKISAIAIVGLLMLAVAGYAILKFTANVTNTANVIGYEVNLIRTDNLATVTSIPWASIEQGFNKTTDQIFNLPRALKIKNVGDFSVFLGWKLNESTPLVDGATLTCEYYDASEQLWYPLAQNTFSAAHGWTEVAINGLSLPLRWTLDIPLQCPRGELGFGIVLLTATTTTG